MKKLSENRAQQAHYRNLVNEAYMAEAQRMNGKIARKDEWRKAVNLAATGQASTTKMNQTTDFDAVMLELAIMADSVYWMNRLASGDERRFRHVIQWFIYDLEYLEKRPIDWNYIKGICKQAGYATGLMDCPVEHLARVLQMLDTHVRRLAKKADIKRAHLPSGYLKRCASSKEAIAQFRHDHHHHINVESAA